MIRHYSLFLLIIIFSIILSISKISAQNQYFFDIYTTRALELASEFRFEKAREQVNISKSLNSKANIPIWVENYIDFIYLLNSEDDKQYQNLKNSKKIRLKWLESGDQNSPYYRYCLGHFHFQWAIIHLKFKDYYTAFKEANTAYRLLEKNYRLYPQFPPSLSALGVLHVFVGSVPDQYNWIKNLLGYKGTVEQGLSELETALEESMQNNDLFWLEKETVFYLSFIYINLDKGKEKSLSFRNKYLSQKDIELEKLDPIQAFAFSKVSLFTGRNDEVIRILRSRKFYPDQTEFTFLDYLLANAYQNKLSDSCLIYYDKYLSYPTVKNFKKSSLQRKAWQYLIKEDREEYYLLMKQVLKTGQEEVDADKQAHFAATKGIIPNVLLLKSRLLFDGGYYNQALNLLLENKDKLNTLPIIEQTEYHYRLGRIYDETHNLVMAKLEYHKAIELGKALPQYYAANASLMMAMIYEKQHQYPLARHHYKMCMDMPFEEYRNSITQKAKIGMERTKKMK
jgi:hypothetical protein